MSNSLRLLLSVALIALAWHNTARAQSLADDLASQETQLPGLRLVAARDFDPRVSSLGIRLGYLEKDVRPGDTGYYFCGALTKDGGVSAAQYVATALARLPYVPVRRLGVRYVILCGGAKAGDRPIGGIPVPPLDLLMLDVGTSDPGFLESATLHELYHLAEIRYRTLADADWDRQFGGYSHSYAPELMKGVLGSGKPGFVDAYAETFPHEDRAELFAALLLKPGDLLARIRATGDSVLRVKVLYVDQKSQRLLAFKLAPDGL